MKRLIFFIFLMFILIGANQTKAQQIDSVLSVSQNPFSIETNLTIHNLNGDTVSLSIYDSFGKIIAGYLTDFVMSGTFSITFNADTLPDGFYLAKLILNNNTFVKKLLKDSKTAIGKQVFEAEKVNVFPNPVKNSLTINSDNSVAKIEVFDLNGNKILYFSEVINGKIDVTELSPGSYIIYITTLERVFIKRIIKI
jgi:hypothetical protein